MHKSYYYIYEFTPKVIKLKVKDFLVLSLHLFGSMVAHPNFSLLQYCGSEAVGLPSKYTVCTTLKFFSSSSACQVSIQLCLNCQQQQISIYH